MTVSGASRLKTDAGKPTQPVADSTPPNGADIARAQRRQVIDGPQGSLRGTTLDQAASAAPAAQQPAAQQKVEALIARITADPATALAAHGRIDPAGFTAAMAPPV